MNNLTKQTFSQALSGNALVFFHRIKGCPNCDRMLPQFATFEKEGVNIFGVDADMERELVDKYAPVGRWELPLTVYFENGKPVKTSTGIINIQDATKTLSNISENELISIKLDTDIEIAQMRKQLFIKDAFMATVMEEVARRHPVNPNNIPPGTSTTTRIEDFPLSTPTVAQDDLVPCDGCQ